MKVKDLIKTLLDYNLEAEIKVIAHCKTEDFSITFGSSDGVEKHNAENVSLYVDSLNTKERSN